MTKAGATREGLELALYMAAGPYKEGQEKTGRRSNAVASNEPCAAHDTLLVALVSYHPQGDLRSGKELPLGVSGTRRGSCRVAISKEGVQGLYVRDGTLESHMCLEPSA